ncbi:carbohydrate porin [Nostoc sp. CENA67]|uniref:Carbohydrate porin n=1 Tax=Amazonocrinis nigriterrae CENA67 TaxID=2794033 RepID=A0A8J7L8L5_9NOST|nr:iron uptake porin [Amazonocrinis nigriterrae]MBH8563320.1 carbohydrate porin [Amazonocrinis nigriterrae CENA67]
MFKIVFYSFCLLLLPIPVVWATDGDRSLQGQVTSVSQFSDVQPTDWAFVALQSLIERYGCIAGYSDSTYSGDRALSRYEFAAGLNACLNRINELIATSTTDMVSKEDLTVLQKLQTEFATELATLRGRVDVLEARTATLESQQFSTTTKLNAQIITAISDTFGNGVGRDGDQSQAYFANRSRLNFESSFTGKDLLRVRLEFGNFLNSNGTSQIASVTGTGMTRLNFDTDSDNTVSIPHIRYYFPVSDSVSFVVGPAGIGYTDITNTMTPATIADDGNGVPSLFGSYSPLFRRGGGGGAVNWHMSKNLVLTLGYLADNPNLSSARHGLFDGGYNALAHLEYYGKQGAFGLAYSHGYSPASRIGLTGGTGSALASSPFGNSIATASDIVGAQGYYRFAPNFQIHAWGGYIWATAKNSGLSDIANGRGGTDSLFVNNGDNANAWFGAIGMSFPDVGGKGNLPGILFGLPPHVSNSDVREDRDNSYHLEAFYRWRVNDNISVTPGFWMIFNPENDSKNDSQYIGVIRTTFDF